jgi:ATP-dependent Clp protease ATP-binding subunit ClpA
VLPALANTVMIPFSSTTKAALARAVAAATNFEHKQIGTWHLLLALTQSPRSMTTQVLKQYDVSEPWLQANRDVMLVDG